MGKGGSGKSTVSSILAKNLSRKGYKILVIDADESNYGLHRQLGLGEPVELIEHLGGTRRIGQKMMEAMRNGKWDEPLAEVLGSSWTISSIPDECLTRKNGMALMQVGKMKHFGEGCACPIGALARNFLQNLVLEDDEVVIVDTEAGVEHLGRGVEKASDLALMVIDPSYESLRLSIKVKEMLEEAGKPVYYVLNRIEDGSSDYLKKKLDPSKVVAEFGNEARLRRAGLAGLEVPERVKGAAALTDFVVNTKEMRG
ncbi:MAG: AAA family ATPase [Methanomassiliicoccales archaeon]|nr:AAA family ATPase [Methanomassiliicoccales archaeon]